MVSVALEESHRAHSEQLLRESEEKFKALFALSPLGMARVRRCEKIGLDCN
jgi:hypothetical protein